MRVAATVTNREPTAKEVKLFVSVDDELLTPTPLTATVPAGGTATITQEWDTTGEAWEHSASAPDRTFEVRLLADNQEAGTKTVGLHVRPAAAGARPRVQRRRVDLVGVPRHRRGGASGLAGVRRR